MKKINRIKFVIIICLVLILFGCLKLDFSTHKEGEWSEPFIATFDIDGSGVELLISTHNNSFSGARPYLVTDLSGEEDDVILLDLFDRIDLVSLDGSDRRTILDTLGNVEYFNQEKTKMLLAFNRDIYLCNVDGSGLKNITNTPEIYESDPSFSYNELSILYTVNSYANIENTSKIYKYTILTHETTLLRSYVEAIESFSFTGVSASAEIANRMISYIRNAEVNYGDFNSSNRLARYDIRNNLEEILCQNLNYEKYSHSKEFLAYYWEGGYLVNIQTGEVTPLEEVDRSPMFSFSASDRYLIMNSGVVDLTTNISYKFSDKLFFEKNNTVSMVDMNRNEDKLIGIVRFLHDE